MKIKFKQKSMVLVIIMCLLLTYTSLIGFATTDDISEKYIDQLIKNTKNPFVLQNSKTEYINPFHGNLNLRYVDLSLAGINGLDFNLIRQYNSHESFAFDIDDNSRITESESNIRTNIGSGWSFNIPYMKYLMKVDNNSVFQVNLGEAGNFIIEKMGTLDTQAKIKGYETHDMNFVLLEDFSECVIDDKVGYYAFILGNGTKYYFSDDSTLIAIRDRFGNQISYEYTISRNMERQPENMYELNKITDTVGREINFDYTSNNLNVSVTGEGQIQLINYEFEKIEDITTIRPEILPTLLLETDIVLKSVTNNVGMTTTYNYDVKAGQKNYFGKTITDETEDILYALIDTITEPGGLVTKYNYGSSIRNNGVGAAEFFKITKRYDEVPNNIPATVNEVDYNYAVVTGQEYDGYPLYSETLNQPLPDDFRIRVSVTNANGLVDYVGDKDLKLIETLSTTEKLKTKEIKKYDINNNIDSITTELSDPTSSNDSVISTVLYEHDSKSRLIGSWGSQTPTTVDALGKYTATSDEYKTTIVIDDRFNIPTSKTYKQDANTIIKESNILSSDGKSVVESQVYENNILKSKISFGYDSYGNITSTSSYEDAINLTNTKSMSYSSNHAFIVGTSTGTFTDVDGNSIASIQTSSTYDYFGNLLTYTDGNGNVTTTIYDNLNRPKKVTNSDNTTVDINYYVLSDGFSIVNTDEKGNDFKLVYDSLGRNIEVIDVLTNNTHLSNEYNTSGKLTKTTDALGNYSIYTYYGNGEKKTAKTYSSSDLLLSSINFIREIGVEDGKYISLTKELVGDDNAETQRSTTFVNAYGLVEKNTVEVDGNDETEFFTYDYISRALTFNSARVLDESLAVPYSWKKEYDYAGNVVKFYNANEDYTENVYDSLGNLKENYDFKSTKETTPYATKNTYDDLGRLIKTEIPFDIVSDQIVYRVKEYIYDSNNNIITERSSNNEVESALTFSVKEYEYDNRNRLIKVTLNNGTNNPVISQYYYDEVGNQLRMYTGLSSPLTITGLDVVSGSDLDYSVTKYEYDHLSNITKFTDPMNQIETYGYNLNGKMTSKTDKNGTTLTNLYDGLNRLTLKTALNGSDTHLIGYTYNKIGLVKEINDNGYVENFEYNDRGLLTKHTYPEYFNSYVYNVIGSVERVVSMQDINPISTSSYKYDELDRLIKVSDMNEEQATYTYDANGNRKDLIYNTSNFGVNYSYNIANIVTNIDNFNSGTLASTGNVLTNELPDYNYDYKLNATPLSETEVNSGVIKTYNYDDINRLINESKSMNGSNPEAIETLTYSEEAPDLINDYSIDYTYDDYGNIHIKVDGSKTTTYTYDKNNRILKEEEVDTNTTIIKRFSYDKNGNTLSTRVETYSKEIGEAGSSLNVNDSDIKIYKYNLLNQQIKVITKSGVTEYTYNASGFRDTKITGNEETKFYWDGSNTIGEAKNDVLVASYLYGIGLINRKDEITNEKNYYFFNVHGDVVSLTDDSGEVVTVYDYNAYGEFNERGLKTENPFTYFGQYYDEETGTYYLRARYYNPSYMRFTSEDTYTGKATDVLSLNRYLYVSGNPVIFVDPSGYKPHPSKRNYFSSGYISEDYYIREVTKQGITHSVPYSPELQAQAEKAAIAGATLLLGDIYDIELITMGYDFEEKRFATKGERAFYTTIFIVPGSAKLIKNGGELVTNKFAKRFIKGMGNDVLFGQKGVSQFFSKKGKFKGASIADITGQLKAGSLSPDELPIEYIVRNGQKVTLNNRSLTALSQAGLKPTVLIDKTGNAFLEKQLTERLLEMGGSPSSSMFIRTIKETVDLP